MGRDTSFFTTIKEQVDLEDYLTKHLGVELVPDGPGRMAACCPFHEERTPSFKVSESEDGPWKRWYCYGSCQTGGTVIDAVMRAENYELAHEAAQYLNELYDLGLDMNSEAYKAFKRTVAETREGIERSRKDFSSDSRLAEFARNYLRNRGFSDETIDYFQLGIQPKTRRLSIPLLDKANHPVSIANRALFDKAPCQSCKQMVEAKEVQKRHFDAKKAEKNGEEPIDWRACPHCGAEGAKAKIAWLEGQAAKYKFLRDFDKTEFLYHQAGARKALKDEGVVGLFVVEGYADVWAGWQSGHKAIVAYNGAVMSEWQARQMVEMATRAEKPIILIPDFDSTGQHNIDPNIRKLRAVRDDVEVQVLWGVDRLTYREPGVDEDKRCKDIGEVLQHHGAEEVFRILRDQRRSAAEWMIRTLVEWRNPKTGEPFHSEHRQMQLVAEILSHEKTKVSLDHLVPYLAQQWEKKEEIIRQWFYSRLSEDNVTSYRHLFKDIKQARDEAREFLQDDNVIPLGFKGLDHCLPGGGVRPGQLSMLLGKSGTGKAQPLDAKVLTPAGYKPMGEIEIGDEVVDPEGGTARVQGVFPQGEREIYRLEFGNGGLTEVECDLEHLWKVRIAGGEWQVLTLREILERIDYRDGAVIADEEVVVPALLTVPGRSDRYRALSSASLWRAYPVGTKPAQCIKLDSDNELYVTDGGIVTHNTMLASQILAHMADTGTRSIIFSLEQAAKSLFSRLACQALDLSMSEVEELIARDDKEAEDQLAPVYETYKNMLILDNVPEAGKDAIAMTPQRIQAIIQEANMTHFKEQPATVVIIDHLGILDVDPDAPREIKGSEHAAVGFIMKRLFAVCKATNVFMLVLQQLPKEIPPGEPFGYDAGRGGSAQTDFCDFIFQVWRPEQKQGLSDEERVSLEGKYMLALGKNRHGPSTVEHLLFDKATLRIMPALQAPQPHEVNLDGPVIELEDGEAPSEEQEENKRSGGQAGASAESLGLLAEETDTLPEDNADLLAQAFGVKEISELDPEELDDIDLFDDGEEWLG